jgi:hypothetical protein
MERGFTKNKEHEENEKTMKTRNSIATAGVETLAIHRKAFGKKAVLKLGCEPYVSGETASDANSLM